MNFTSALFLIFFPVVCGIYWILPGGYRKYLLLAASYLFYMSWKPLAAGLLFLVTLVTYFAGLQIADPFAGISRRKVWRLIGVVVPLTALILFKNANFMLVAGISFYTFQALSYVLDVYRGRLEAEKYLTDYALYISFFPQLVAGPIERPGNLLPQLKEVRQKTPGMFQEAGNLLLTGYFKKIVIADVSAIYADRIFNLAAQGEMLPVYSVILGAMLFAIQIYGDFSGYSDIARGCAKCFGVELMENFRFPYLAENIREFWSCWHISLTTWFTDYVYIPLGGSRRGFFRTCIHIWIVFLLSGIWHGFAWHFVAWGCFHGFFMILYRCLNCLLPDDISVSKWVKRMLTFTIVCMAWILFRAENLQVAGSMFHSMLQGWNRSGWKETQQLLGMDIWSVLQLGFSMAFLYFLDVEPKYRKEKSQSSVSWFGILLLILITWLWLLGRNQGNAFIYFQF